jgi:hypothetical protein
MTQRRAECTSIRLWFLLAVTCLASGSVHACTIFVLTDTNRVLFCNNEDVDETRNRIWFIPSGKKRYGCAYVGRAGDQWAQGGLNTQGLAFDWVAGAHEKWTRGNRQKKRPRGNPAERMLETCSTVAEAIAFFHTHKEPSFSYAHMLVADRSGTSAIIGAKDERLQIEQRCCSRGFGYGRRVLATMLPQNGEPTVTNAGAILSACRQGYGTKYSNVFDLKSGEIFLFLFPDHPDPVKLNLAEELNKGRHYYDMREIKEQLGQKLRRPSRFKEWGKNLYCWLRKT